MQNLVRLFLCASLLAACDATTQTGTPGDRCGAAQYQNLVGKSAFSLYGLDVARDTRIYGREERTETNRPRRLNFVVSGTAVEAVTDPRSTVIRVFCG